MDANLWYVDVATNSVVVTAKPGAEADARALVAARGAPAEVVRETQGPNGSLVDPEGRLIVTEAGARRVTRTEADGSVTVLAETYEGKRLNSPNDLALDSRGRIYFTDPRYGDFSSGNVLATPLAEILAGASGTPWVGEFLDGVEACRSSCPYFGFCGGGHAANRYFEQGRFSGTETEHCRNSKIYLLEGVLEHARDHQSPAA